MSCGFDALPMTSGEYFDSNDFPADGIVIEILNPNLIILPVLESKLNANNPVQLYIGITNNKITPFRFYKYSALIPELIGSDGQKLRGRQRCPREIHSLCDIVWPGRSILASIKISIYWRKSKLRLKFFNESYLLWSFDGLQPGSYHFRFKYYNNSYSESTGETIFKETVTDILATQFINFRLIEIAAYNLNAATEVEGIRFETLMPFPVLTISENLFNVNTPAQFGIRVTNLTQIPYRFIFFGLMPELQSANGQVIQRSYSRNVTHTHQEYDYLLAMSGESLTFLLDAEFYRWDNKLNLRGYEGSGGVWGFHNLKSGAYQVRFTYENRTAVGKIYQGGGRWKKIFDDLWTGMVPTPWVEFCLR